MKRLLVLLVSAASALGTTAWRQKQSTETVTPRMLVEMTDISGVALSPDETRVVFRLEKASVERNTYDSDWYVMAVDNSVAPLRVADGGPPLRLGGVSEVGAPQWSADSQWIYFQAVLDGGIQIWRASRDGRTTQQITRDAADVERFRLEADLSSLIYEVGATREEIAVAEQQEYDSGILFDETTDGLRNLFRNQLIGSRLSTSRTIAQSGLLADHPKAYRVLALDTGAVSPATDAQIASITSLSPTEGVSHQAASLDGSLVGRLTAGSEGSELRIVSTADGSSRVCEPCRSMKIDGFAWRGPDEVVFAARVPGRGFAQSLYAWNIGGDRTKLIAESDGLLNGGNRFGAGSPCAVGTQYAFCVAASADAPPRLDRIDLETGNRLAVFDPNARLAQDTHSVATVEFLSWQDTSGRTFTGHLFMPKNYRTGERLPLFITYYICPGYLRGGFGEEWPLITMASSGIASLCINQNKDGESDLSTVNGYDTGLAGIEAVINQLDGRGIIDRTRVGMGGLSFGGEVAAWVAGKTDLLAAVSVANPQASPYLYWSTALLTGRSESLRKFWGLGSPDETPDEWRRISPVFYAERITAPFLMQLAEGEYRANVELHARLVELNHPVEMRVFPNAAHWKYEPRQKLAAYERNLDWFRFWLQGYEDLDPRKAEQYRHWREMRAAQDGRD